jgi:hypothetical protein
MMEPFESSGVWWLPDDPSGRVAGVLRYSHQDGLALDLLGTLGAGTGVGTKTHAIVLGSVIDSPGGQSVTLTGCRQDRFTATLSGLITENYDVERAFLGRHLSKPGEFLFSKCVIETSGLSAWAAHLRGLQTDYDDEPGEGEWQVRVTYTPPRALRAAIPSGGLVLSCGVAATSGLRESSLREKVGIAINVEEPIGVGEWNFRYVYPLLNLLTLVTDTPNALTQFRLSEEDTPGGPVEVVGHRVFAVKDSTVMPGGILVPLQDVEARFPALIARWLAVAEQYRDACNVFFSLRYAPGAYVDVRLLGNSQSLGLYEMRRAGGGSPDPAVLPPEILASLPTEAQEALGRWAEGVTIDPFPATLRRLAAEHDATLTPLAPKGLNHLVDRIIRYRDYALYRQSLPDGRSHYAIGLHLVTETLASLMKSCFLAELGFTPEERAFFFRHNATYDFLRSGWASISIGGEGQLGES